MLSVQWVRLTDPTAWLAWLAMALIFSLWWPGFLALARLSVFRLRLPLMMAAPILWVGMEFIRAFLLTGFPWYYLGHSQFRFLTLIQIADTTMRLGISFLVALVNAWFMDLLSLPLLRSSTRGTRLTQRQTVRLWIVTVLMGGNLVYGAYRLSTAQFRAGPRLALLQTNFEQRYKMGGDPLTILERIEHLIERAIAAQPRPDLIVWPETAYPYGYIVTDPATPPAELARQVGLISNQITAAEWIDKKQKIAEHLHDLTDRAGVPMLIGAILYDHRPGRFSKYNAAILFQPLVRSVQAYNKIHLVPFGEFIPFLDTLPWLTVFTPYRNGYVPTLTFGKDPLILTLGPYRMAIGICFEDTVPHVIRRFFRETEGGRQPDMLINLSNDGWFHGSVRAGHASGRQRLPHDRAPGPPGPGSEHGDLGLDRRQRRDPGHAAAPDRERTERHGATRRPHQFLHGLGRLAGNHLPCRHDRAGAARSHPPRDQGCCVSAVAQRAKSWLTVHSPAAPHYCCCKSATQDRSRRGVTLRA